MSIRRSHKRPQIPNLRMFELELHTRPWMIIHGSSLGPIPVAVGPSLALLPSGVVAGNGRAGQNHYEPIEHNRFSWQRCDLWRSLLGKIKLVAVSIFVGAHVLDIYFYRLR
jgi:hypothetical protein